MNLSEIKSELFSRVTIADFGIKIEWHDAETAEAMKAAPEEKPFFTVTFYLLHSGSIRINSPASVFVTGEQLNEVNRIANQMKMKYNEYMFGKDYDYEVIE